MGETIWSKTIDDILRVGVSLEALGVKNWAIPQNIALETLDRLEASGVAILGGDVLELRGSVLCYNYDNWHCGDLNNQPMEVFAKKSIEIARAYIIYYKVPVGLNIYFSFVPDVGK